VRYAAAIAEEFSAGHLSERMKVRGEDDLARLARSFNDMAESLQLKISQLEDLSRVQRRFVSDVSHELRTPLTTVRMATDVLHEARGSFDPATARSAELLQNQLDRFEALLADLLEISRFDAGAATLDPVRGDLRDTVASVVEVMRPLAERMGTGVRLHPCAEPATAEYDPRRVDRILRNLLANAFEHGEGEPIDVRVGVSDDAVAVCVRDHGTGLRPGESSLVFNRFWRADPARARSLGGTGLGLSIVQRLSTLLGGDIAVRSAQGDGSVFTLRLPVVLAPPALAALPPAAGALSSVLCDHEPPSPFGRSPPTAIGGGEVLVAEDHPASRRLIEAQLGTLGFSARLTGDGEEAWSSLCERPVAAIITDYHMPHLDGVGLARRIRADRRLAHVWIIGLTADVRDGSMRDCIDAGMDVVLVKPTSLAAIDRALAAAARPGGNGAAETPAPAAADPQALAGEWPVFDPANLCEAFGGLDRQALELLQSFVDDTGACLMAIRCHVSDRQARPLAQAAHRLAGTCLSIGAPRLGHLCRDLERAALTFLEQPHGDWAQADRLMVAIEAGLGALSAAVAVVCDDQRSTSW
jgi:signal transduction histidine kinase/CheY-like chemotaxis protein